LIQVLTNLLDNAFKFTPPGGRIAIQAGRSDAQVWVTVADTGIGIASAELPNLFQEFYRGGARHAAERQGMGLGLTISREIIRAHGGTIRVASELGRGARFTFTLPLQAS
jgi:signal transduction histidine kinase